jgi:AcrR family transcriptional regulator
MRRKPDRRIERTRQRLGAALVELIQEKPFIDVTVQEVLDRAGVGRSTFYVHFRDKNDLLLSRLEEFLQVMSTSLSDGKEKSERVAPVTEMFAHIGKQTPLYRTLNESGHLTVFFDLAQTYFMRGIERWLGESGRFAKLPRRELNARASALAGSLLSLMRWWLDRGTKETPGQMDKLFHRMVWTGVR